MASSSFAENDPLKSFHWEHRIILVTAPSDQVDGVIADLKGARAAIEERDILWFVIAQESMATNQVESPTEKFRAEVLARYFEDDGGLQVRLIGKDGGVKVKADALNLPELFGRIDAMPMRQAEMRRN